MIFMDKDEFLLKRIRELANLSYQRDIVTFTDFLNLNEQNMLATLKLRQMGVECEAFRRLRPCRAADGGLLSPVGL